MPDRECLTLVSRGVPRQEPGETIVGIVGRLLLRIDDRKAEPLGELRPAATTIVLRSALTAAVQRDDHWRIAWQALGLIDRHAQVTRVGTKRRHLTKSIGFFARSLQRRDCFLAGSLQQAFELAAELLKVAHGLVKIAH